MPPWDDEEERPGSEPLDLGEGYVTRSTDKALLVMLDSDKKEHWVPLSQIHDDSEIYNHTTAATGNLIVKAWWAEKAGLA